MKKSNVERMVDLANLPPLTEAERVELAGLRGMTDVDIDRSDIPRLTDAFWRSAVPNPFGRPTEIDHDPARLRRPGLVQGAG